MSMMLKNAIEYKCDVDEVLSSCCVEKGGQQQLKRPIRNRRGKKDRQSGGRAGQK